MCMETIAKVRRWVKADGMSIREAARKAGICRNTARKYLRNETVEPEYRQHMPRGSRRLLDHEVHLKGMYEADLARPVRERRSMQGLYEALLCEGYTGSYDTVRRYIVRLKGSGAGVGQGYIPLEFDAGDALQFDWRHEVVVLGGVEQKIRVAHFRLSHSRKPFIIAYLRESQEMVLDAFNRAFSFYGGVPRRVIVDNAKTMVAFIGKGKERRFHSRFLACMSHYAVEPVACTPASGWEKGQVESQVKTLRGQVFTPKLYFDTLADLNVHLQVRCEALASKPHPEAKTRSVGEVFADEREVLRSLGRSFDGYTERTASVSGHCLVRFDTNDYSVSCRYARSPVSLRAYADRIVITDGKEVIAEHERCFDKHQKRFCIWHYLPLFEQRPGALRDGAPFKRWVMPGALKMIWDQYRGQPGGDRDFIELLMLYQQHGQDAVEMACGLAVEYGTMQLSAIIVLLHDLTEPDSVKEMTAEEVSYPRLQLPPEVNCHRYDQLLSTGKAA